MKEIKAGGWGAHPDNFEKPDFIKPEIQETKYRKTGANWIVQELSNLPPDLMEKSKGGLVVKQLQSSLGGDFISPAIEMFREHGGEYVAASDLELLKERFERTHGRPPTNDEIRKFDKQFTDERISYLEKIITPQGIAEKLGERQKFYKDFYGKVLPDLVLHHDYVVGKGEEGENPQIYAFQEKTDLAKDLKKIIDLYEQEFYGIGDQDYEGWDSARIKNGVVPDFVTTFGIEECRNIADEIFLFVGKTREMITRHGFAPDLTGGAIGITREGKLCLYDIDKVWTWNPYHENKTRMNRRYLQFPLHVLEMLAEELKNAAEKEDR